MYGKDILRKIEYAKLTSLKRINNIKSYMILNRFEHKQRCSFLFVLTCTDCSKVQCCSKNATTNAAKKQTQNI